MSEYLIAFNDTWVPDHTADELRARSESVRGLVAEMKAAGVLNFTGGPDDDAPVFSVDASSGIPGRRHRGTSRSWSQRFAPDPAECSVSAG